jgi:PKD repeat protein
MDKIIVVLGFCFSLLIFCVSTASAQVAIPVDPGVVDECVDQSIIFPSPGLPFDLVFTDNKTLTLGPGTLTFVLQGSGLTFEGALLDVAGNEISGTEYFGLAEGDATEVPLSQSTTWHGMRFVSDFPIGPAGLVFSSCPVVGLSDVSGNQKPIAEANGPYTGDVSEPIAFDSSGSFDPDGDIVSYLWNFGDGTSSTEANPTHAYSIADTWNVTLEVTDDVGGVDSDSTQATVGQDSLPPQADAGGPYPGEANVDLVFNGAGSTSSNPGGSIVQYDWDFGDGFLFSTTNATPTHNYAANGLYPVTLRVTDEVGGTDEDTTWSVIGELTGEPPIAAAGGPYTGATNATITFDGTESEDPDGDIVFWRWSFGDGAVDNSGSTPSHIYTTSGTFDVILLVQDDEGRVDSHKTTATIGVGNLPPDNVDPGGPYFGTTGEAVSFSASADDPDGVIDSYAWDFGDGAMGSGETTTHTYASEGQYIVNLTVTDNSSASKSVDTSATIEAAPPPPPPPPPPEEDDDCFIATAAYGSYLEPEVMTLRQFRDRWLLTNAPGRAFVSFYYRTSPPVADTIAANDGLRLLVRALLTPVVYVVKYPLASGALLLLFVAWRVRRRRPGVSKVAAID